MRRFCNSTSKCNLKYELTKTKRHFVALGGYSSVVNCGTKNYRDISRDIWNFTRYFKILFVYSAISNGTPKDVLRNPCWETLHYDY